MSVSGNNRPMVVKHDVRIPRVSHVRLAVTPLMATGTGAFGMKVRDMRPELRIEALGDAAMTAQEQRNLLRTDRADDKRRAYLRNMAAYRSRQGSPVVIGELFPKAARTLLYAERVTEVICARLGVIANG